MEDPVLDPVLNRQWELMQSPEELWRRAGEWCDSHLRPWSAPPAQPLPTPAPGEEDDAAVAAAKLLGSTPPSSPPPPGQPRGRLSRQGREGREHSLYFQLGVHEALFGSDASGPVDEEIDEIR